MLLVNSTQSKYEEIMKNNEASKLKLKKTNLISADTKSMGNIYPMTVKNSINEKFLMTSDGRTPAGISSNKQARHLISSKRIQNYSTLANPISLQPRTSSSKFRHIENNIFL